MWGVLLLVALCCATSRSSHVLVVFPVPEGSHHVAGQSVVDILLNAGHEVTYVTPFPQDVKNPRLRHVDISPIFNKKMDRDGIVQQLHSPTSMHQILQIGPSIAQRALQHHDLKYLLDDTSITFDLIIADWFYSGLLSPLAAVYSCPLIWYSVGDVSWQTLRLVHESSSPVFSVDLHTKHLPSVPYTIGQRAYQLGLQLYLTGWTYYIGNHVEEPLYRELYSTALQHRGREQLEYESLVYNASLLLVNSHPPLGQRLPLPQNVKYVGGHHVELPTKPLNKNMQRLLDKAKSGAIFFSMDPSFTNTSERMKIELVDMFGQLEQTVIWKFEEQRENLPRNLFILDWVSDSSILDHPNTVLLISPGDQLSVIEATHFGVPVVGIPQFGDQFVNVDQAVARGCAIRLDFDQQMPWKILEAVNEILQNDSFQHNAKQASSIFRQRLSTPQHELMHWIQAVLHPAGGSLRSPVVALSVAERWHVDLLAVLLMVLWFLSKVLKLLKVYIVPTQDSDKKHQ